MWNIWIESYLHAYGEYGFHFADLHETHNHGIHFVGIHFAKFYLNQIKM